jgi:hypothetical protein
MLNRKNNDELSKEQGLLMKDTRCGSLCLDFYEPHKCFAPFHQARKRSWGLNFTALWEGIQNARQTRWVGFSAKSTISHALSL